MFSRRGEVLKDVDRENVSTGQHVAAVDYAKDRKQLRPPEVLGQHAVHFRRRHLVQHLAAEGRQVEARRSQNVLSHGRRLEPNLGAADGVVAATPGTNAKI
jgi:hypothetical protein